jgi:hypothetical protein
VVYYLLPQMLITGVLGPGESVYQINPWAAQIQFIDRIDFYLAGTGNNMFIEIFDVNGRWTLFYDNTPAEAQAHLSIQPNYPLLPGDQVIATNSSSTVSATVSVYATLLPMYYSLPATSRLNPARGG